MNPETYYKNNFYGIDRFNFNFSLLKLENHQKQILDTFHKGNNVSIEKSRQIGMSSILALYVSYMMLYGNKKNIVICIPNMSMGSQFLSKIKMILFKSTSYGELDGHLKEYGAKLYYGDCLVRVVSNVNMMKGSNIDLLIIDEAAHIKSLEEIFLGVAPMVLAKKGQIISTSSSGSISGETFKKWHLNIKKEFHTYKRELILEKIKNIKSESRSMFYRAKFN
tara:strand:+ start:716 stop:1381 length:666 start_codon:yes stop_codon:yes gene_type:complete